jgi:hypothetical protein
MNGSYSMDNDIYLCMHLLENNNRRKKKEFGGLAI